MRKAEQRRTIDGVTVIDVTTTVKDHDGDEHSSTRSYIEYGQDLLKDLSNYGIRYEGMFERPYRIPASVVVRGANAFTELAECGGPNASMAGKILRIANGMEVEALERVSASVARGLIEFDDILRHIKVGSRVIWYDGGARCGGTVTGVDDKTNSYYQHIAFSVRYTSASKSGMSDNAFTTIRVGRYEGPKALAALPIMVASYEDVAGLQATARVTAAVINGGRPNHVRVEGSVQGRSMFGFRSLSCRGRMMVDFRSYTQFTDEEPISFYNTMDGTYEEADVGDGAEPWTLNPWVYGYSMYLKRWVRVLATDVQAVDYREDAFEKLVMDGTKKSVIRALVHQGGGRFTDIIAGKGGGAVFMLYGPPGTGKTLTAESVCELLHKPLYVVDAGELGTTPEQLEASLRRILEMAEAWDAGVLIDEADVFLERRSSSDVVRNALVGVFLRQLEYHSGILFLTTNRAGEIDEAFLSRVSVALRYEKLDKNSRRQVWTNLLDSAGAIARGEVDGRTIEWLSQHDINGRQIKNAIRTALSLAAEEGAELSRRHLSTAVELSMEFIRTVGAPGRT